MWSSWRRLPISSSGGSALQQVRYISLIGDYFPLFLILAIATSGVLMRYFTKTDIVSVKILAMGLVSFSQRSPTA